ncbi:MAG: hypothetical protein GXY61_12155 [Lentisphaerae bacterium]|nr:hypothetical protein [Lentisphaerota bacterium]
MGIFADRCGALIDPETGRALSGGALIKAREGDAGIYARWPRCNNIVKKTAKFCNICGMPAPKGWWRCPHCRKTVRSDSRYCWNCSAQLHPESRVNIAGGVWNKEPSVFAQRFEIGDIDSMLKRDLQIQAGTVALLIDGGKFKGNIDAGQYDPDSLLRKINHFGSPPPRSVILVDAGDVILPVRIDNLRSSEGMELEFYGEIVVRFDPKKAQDFVENRMKDNRELAYNALSDVLQGEIRHAVDALCTTSTIDDLVRDPERRIRLQDEMSSSLGTMLERSGIELIHVSSAEFSGDAYEKTLEQQGDNEKKRREIEYNTQLRNMLSQETMEKFKSEQDLKEYQELLVHEYQISELQRSREEKLLLRGWKHQDELEDLRQSIHIQEVSADAEIGLKTKHDDYARGKQVADAEAMVQARAKTFGQEKVETDQALEWRRQKGEIRQQELAALSKVFSGKSMEEMIALCEDPQRREQLLRLHEQQVKAGISERELLAAAKLESLEEQKKMTEAGAERLERVMTEALKAKGEAAKQGGGNTIINK